MQESPAIVVVGSINMDLVVRVPHAPRAGETVIGRDLATIPGGKGANQAVAAARLGSSVAIVGRVGDDDFGDRMRTTLAGAHVDTRHVTVTEGAATGVALISVDVRGENAIAVSGGANRRLSPADVDAAAEIFSSARVCLLQLEIPLETVLHAIRVCRSAGVETILDAAPAPDDPPAELFAADILSPNLAEAEALAREPAAGHREAKALAAALAARGARQVVIKLGEHGALYYDGERFEHVPELRIMPVDTTAAGDAFTAALAVARARGDSLSEAVRLANAAGAAACLKFGAQPSLPTMREVVRLIQAD